jgi:hypothetical protein
MTKVYDLDYHRLQKEKQLKNTLGISDEEWKAMKSLGLNPTLRIDRDIFYESSKYD